MARCLVQEPVPHRGGHLFGPSREARPKLVLWQDKMVGSDSQKKKKNSLEREVEHLPQAERCPSSTHSSFLASYHALNSRQKKLMMAKGFTDPGLTAGACSFSSSYKDLSAYTGFRDHTLRSNGNNKETKETLKKREFLSASFSSVELKVRSQGQDKAKTEEREERRGREEMETGVYIPQQQDSQEEEEEEKRTTTEQKNSECKPHGHINESEDCRRAERKEKDFQKQAEKILAEERRDGFGSEDSQTGQGRMEKGETNGKKKQKRRRLDLNMFGRRQRSVSSPSSLQTFVAANHNCVDTRKRSFSLLTSFAAAISKDSPTQEFIAPVRLRTLKSELVGVP